LQLELTTLLISDCSGPIPIERKRTGLLTGADVNGGSCAPNEHPRADVMIVPCEKKPKAPRKEHARNERTQSERGWTRDRARDFL
jgi:hypothetical protein